MPNYIWPQDQIDTVRVIDGDTIGVTLDLGFKVSCYQVLRLARINCPERNQREAWEKAKSFVEERIASCDEIKIVSYKRGRYGRYLCDIFINGVNLNNTLIEKGLAVAYEEKKNRKRPKHKP